MGYLVVESNAMTPDAAPKERWIAQHVSFPFVGRKDATKITTRVCTEHERQAMVRQAEKKKRRKTAGDVDDDEIGYGEESEDAEEEPQLRGGLGAEVRAEARAVATKEEAKAANAAAKEAEEQGAVAKEGVAKAKGALAGR
jgi:hypothetical protein